LVITSYDHQTPPQLILLTNKQKKTNRKMPLTPATHVIPILSGKGGVGKSSVTAQLALALCLRGRNVAVLDLDLTGPNMHRMLGVESARVVMGEGGGMRAVVVHEEVRPAKRPRQDLEDANGGETHEARSRQPESADQPQDVARGAHETRAQGAEEEELGSLSVMSLGFLLGRSTAAIWRGPKKSAMVRDLLTRTLWPGRVDVLLVDTPPGTSDEHITLLEALAAGSSLPGGAGLAGAVVVTTPQAVSVADVRKELRFCEVAGARVLGVLENMAGFVCPHCAACAAVFGRGGGEALARERGVAFLGAVPLDPALGRLVEEGVRPAYPSGTEGGGGEGLRVREGERLVEKYTSCVLWGVFDAVVGRVLGQIGGVGDIG
jgi:Mrp family chromosome partitioning ATPase